MAIALSYARGSVKEVADELGINPGRGRENDWVQVLDDASQGLALNLLRNLVRSFAKG